MILKKKNGYLENKLNNLKGFFSLIFGKLSEQMWAILDEKIIECYNQKGINFKDESLYKDDGSMLKPEFKKSEDMPILEDLYRNIIK